MTWFDFAQVVNLFITLPLFILSATWFFLIARIARDRFQKSSRKSYTGSVAVLIPCFNEEQNIELCLRAILTSSFPHSRMKIYLSDDGSTDNSLAIAESIFKEFPECRHTIFHRDHVGKALGMKATIEQVEEDICILIDADTFVTDNCIAELAAPYIDENIDAVSGCILVWKPENLLELCQSIEYCFCMLLQRTVSFTFGTSIYLSGQACSVRRQALQRIGGMPTGLLTEDYEIFLRFMLEDRIVRWNQKAIAYTRACSTIKSLLLQRMRWWFGCVSLLVSHKKEIISHICRKDAPHRYVFTLMIFEGISCFNFSLFVYPTTLVLFYNFLPDGTTMMDILEQAFFWFSSFGPLRVLYKLSEWGVNWFLFFGVLSGITFLCLKLIAVATFRHASIRSISTILFIFPYYLLIVLAIPLSLVYYRRRGSRQFID